MSVKKDYQKNATFCKVTFMLSKKASGKAKTAHLVGEFNNWETYANPLSRQKDGSFSAALNLETGREYQFRYLLDGNTWVNDEAADRQAPTPFGNSENSVISL